MAFLRRRSGVYHEDVYSEDFDLPRYRRRLSKPLTNSASNLGSLSQQQRRKSTGRHSTDEASPISHAGSRELMKTQLFSLTSDLDLTKMNNKPSQVALLAARFEKGTTGSASGSQLSLVSAKTAQRPPPQTLSRRASADQHDSSSDNSWSKCQTGHLDIANVSPMSSFEQVAEDSFPPPRRSASFLPGAATRGQNQPQETIQEETASLLSNTARTEERDNTTLARSSTHEEWTPPPQNDRPVTPSDLEYAHIGRLGLGSLRITNGAVSPAPSDMLKFNKANLHLGLRRDCSSVYPESEAGTLKHRKQSSSRDQEDTVSPLKSFHPSHEKPEMYRAFSFNPGSEAVLDPSNKERLTKSPTSNAIDTSEGLADEYIAELPTSPYAVPSPPETPQISHTESQARTDKLALVMSQVESSGDTQEIHESPSLTPASQGTVIRHAVQPSGRNLFYRDIAVMNEQSRPESPASFFSMPSTDHELDDRFKSAVEIQPARTRSKSPQKMVGSPLREAHRSFHLIPRRPLPSKSDSGYSSDNSTPVPPPMPDASVAEKYRQADRSPERRALRLPFRKAVQSPSKPVLVQPTPSTKVASPSTAQIESISAFTSVASLHAGPGRKSQDTASVEPVSPTKGKDKIRKKLQKNKRKSTADAARELVVQRIVSIDCLNVPVITTTARSSLAQRSEAIPELDATYRTQEHTARITNASVLTLAPPVENIVFPSADPVQDEGRQGRARSHSRTRRRSISRPRSWFGWSKEEKDDTKTLTKAEVTDHLNEFGTVVELLGSDPYEIARTPEPRPSLSNQDLRPDLLRRRTSPSNIDHVNSRPRSMMDDEDAKEVAKQRRLSNAEKRAIPTSRHSFDDRGGIPGKLPQFVRVPVNAPPLPPLPSADEINRRYSCKLGITPSPSAKSFEQEINNNYMQGVTQAPPTPAHSPYIEQTQASRAATNEPTLPHAAFYSHEQFHSPVEQHEHHSTLNEEFAPPPPSHSPHPVDITDRAGRQRDVSWGESADAWYARRRSASANLQDAYIETGQYNQAIPRRPLPQATYAPPGAHYDTTYDAPEQGEQFVPQYEYSEAYDVDYYEHAKPFSQHHSPAGGFEPWNSANDHYQWEEDYRQQYYPNPSQRAVPTPDYYHPDNSGYESYHGAEQFHPKLMHRHTWQPNTHEDSNSHLERSHRFYAEYNKGNIPYPGSVVNRRAQTYDDQPRPESRRSKQSPSRSQSRPNSRHSHHSRPTSRHSHHSQHHGPPVEELPVQHYSRPVRSDRSPRHDRYSGRTGYDPRLLPRAFDEFGDQQSHNTDRRHNMNRQKQKRSSWLDMEAYGIDFDGSGRQMPIRRSTIDRMLHG